MTALRILAATLVVASASGVAVANPRFIPIQNPDEHRCPELARGARLTVEPITGGVALEITTPKPQHEAELRELTRAVAEVVEEQSNEVTWQPTSAQSDVSIPPVDVEVSDIGSGVRVMVRARHAHDIDVVRVQATVLERLWERSDCINGSAFPGVPSISA
jgi:hypothetical protein